MIPHFIVLLVSVIMLTPVTKTQMIYSFIFPITKIQIDNQIFFIVDILFTTLLFISVFAIRKYLKRSNLRIRYLIYFLVLLFLLENEQIEEFNHFRFMEAQTGLRAVELLQEPSSIHYSVDSIGKTTINGEVHLRNHSRENILIKRIILENGFKNTKVLRGIDLKLLGADNKEDFLVIPSKSVRQIPVEALFTIEGFEKTYTPIAFAGGLSVIPKLVIVNDRDTATLYSEFNDPDGIAVVNL